MAPDDQAAGIDIRQIIAAGPRRRGSGRGNLAHRHGLAGEQQFIALQIMRREHGRIGRHAVAFGKNDEVAAHHFGAGNAFLDAVADHERARAGQIAQAFEHPLGAGFLNDGDQNRGAGKNAEHDSFLEIAEDEIDDGRAQQQREHRLAQDLEDNADKGAAVGLREGIGTLRFKARGGFLVGKASEYPESRRPRSLPGDENRAAGVAHDPCCIGAEQVILHGRPMRSDDDEIGPGFLGDPQNLRIDAGAVRDENVGLKVGSIDTPDQGGDPVFQIRGDQLIAERCRLGLQDGLDLAHDGEDMKPGAEGARELDRREQRLAAGGFIIKVNGEQNVLVHVSLAQSVVRPISNISLNKRSAMSVIGACF